MDARGDGNMCSAHGRQSTRNELASMKATRSTLRDGGRVRQNDATNPVHNTHPNVDNRQSTNEKSFSFAVQHCVLFLTLSLSLSFSRWLPTFSTMDTQSSCVFAVGGGIRGGAKESNQSAHRMNVSQGASQPKDTPQWLHFAQVVSLRSTQNGEMDLLRK